MIDFNAYLKEIEKGFQSKLATEHTYRPFLKTFVESFGKDIEAINEPKRRTFGAPDYVIRKREIPLGYIEAKDVGKDLDKLAPGTFTSAVIKSYKNGSKNTKAERFRLTI